MTDIEAMRSYAEDHELAAELALDHSVTQMLDRLYHLRLDLKPEAVALAAEIRGIALHSKTPYRGRYLQVALTRNPLTGKLEAEIVRRQP